MKKEVITGLDGAEAMLLANLREAMVSQPPSRENPFRTRRNRLRRVNYMMRAARRNDSLAET